MYKSIVPVRALNVCDRVVRTLENLYFILREVLPGDLDLPAAIVNIQSAPERLRLTERQSRRILRIQRDELIVARILRETDAASDDLVWPTDFEPLNEVPPVLVREPAGHEPRRLVPDTNLHRIQRPARAIRDGSRDCPGRDPLRVGTG